MAERWYIVPVSRGLGGRHRHRFAKYVEADAGQPLISPAPGGTNTMDYDGWDGGMLVHCPNITRAAQAAMDRQADVFSFPEDLTAPVSPPDRAALRLINAGGLLGADVDGPGTYGELLDELMAALLRAQRHYGMHGRAHLSAAELDAAMTRTAAADTIAAAKAEALRRRGGG